MSLRCFCVAKGPLDQRREGPCSREKSARAHNAPQRWFVTLVLDKEVPIGSGG